MNTGNIGFIGAGNMANSLIRGLLTKGVGAENIWVFDIDSEKLQQLNSDCGVNIVSSNEIAQSADVIVLAVKPQAMKEVCLELRRDLASSSCLLISIAAGISLSNLQNWLGGNEAIVRCMPNTPALVGKGATGLFANKQVSEEQKLLAQQILSAVGLSLWVQSEEDIDTVTAVSGSGPAYFFLFIEAMQEAAMGMGLSQELAKALCYQTALGAAELALASEENINKLRQKVTSPGGTTERAIAVFEEGNLKELVNRALVAAQQRSKELANEFGTT